MIEIQMPLDVVGDFLVRVGELVISCAVMALLASIVGAALFFSDDKPEEPQEWSDYEI